MSEAEIVRAFNQYFVENAIPGIAYRRKQHQFTSQYCDIIVDTGSTDHRYLALEHKSFKLSSSRKLYFSQHFSDNTKQDELEEGHQIERIDEFADRSGRKAFLAVEVRQGRGKPKRLFFMEWDELVEKFNDWKSNKKSIAGFSVDWLENNAIEAERDGEYSIPEKLVKP